RLGKVVIHYTTISAAAARMSWEYEVLLWRWLLSPDPSLEVITVMSTLRTLLLTGADSALSRAVLASLPDSLHLRAVDTHFTASLPRNLQGVEGDLCDAQFLSSRLQDVDTVLHFAPLSVP